MTPAPWPGSDVAFSQVREDPAIEVALLAGSRAPARVLLVCSGGCTALTLLPLVGRVDAVDPSPAQLHLCALKLAAARALPRDEVHALLGVTRAAPAARLTLYAQARGLLEPAPRAHWDAREAQVAYGLAQVGDFEALFRELAQAFRDDGLEPLRRPQEALRDPHWRERFERVFERERLARRYGRAAVAFSMDRTFGEHFADVFARALRRYAEEGLESYFLHQVWEDRYGPALPDWLREPERLREAPERLHLHQGRFLDLLDELADDGPAFDLVQTSNISDWMPVPELEAMVDRIAARLAPGGALLMRRLNGDHDLQALVARRLAVDPRECESLQRHDRSFFYREVVVGRAP